MTQGGGDDLLSVTTSAWPFIAVAAVLIAMMAYGYSFSACGCDIVNTRGLYQTAKEPSVQSE